MVVTYGFSLGVGFLTSSMRPDIFFRKRLCRCFSSMSFSLRVGLPAFAMMRVSVSGEVTRSVRPRWRLWLVSGAG